MMKLIVLVLIGAVFHILMKLRSAVSEKPTTEKFNLRKDFNWRRHIIFSLISVWLPIIVVVFREYTEILLGIAINPLNAFLLGAFNDSLWKDLKSSGKKRTIIK